MNTQIERVEAPTREEFESKYLRQNKPVIITGVASKWPAITKWNADYFKKVAASNEVSVHFQEDANTHHWYNPSAAGPVDRRMAFGDFLHQITAVPPDLRYFMTEHPLKKFLPELLDDIGDCPYVDSPPQIFMGRDYFMPLHYHGNTEAFLCQLRETKKVTLYAPSQFPRLYPHPWYSNYWHFSKVDTREPDVEARFPKFKMAQPLTFRLEPGEMLYIPVQWWHVTRVPSPEISISVSYVWASHWKRYRYPLPGLLVQAHVLLFALKRARGRASRLLRGR